MKNNDKNHIDRCFSKAAIYYDHHNLLQNFCGNNLILSTLNYINLAKNIIDVGCGTGHITAKLTKYFGYQHLFAIDIAENMVKMAKKRLTSLQAHVEKNDFDNFNDKSICFDLIFSNLSLQWSNNFFETICYLSKKLTNKAFFVFCIPLKNTFLTLENKNQFYSANDIKYFIMHAGLNLIEKKEEQLIFEFYNWIDALKAIKSTGANYVFKKNYHSLGGNSFIKKLIRTNNKVNLNYHIGYFITQKCY